MTTVSAAEPYYDPYDYDDRRRRRTRSGGGSATRHRCTGTSSYGFYALSRFDDVLPAMLDTETFRSAHMTVLEMITEEPYERRDDDHDGPARSTRTCASS